LVKSEDKSVSDTKEVTLKPGKSSVVKLAYSVHGSGTIEEGATLKTNDPMRPLVHLTLRGTVPQNLQVDPSALFFNALKGQKLQREMTIVGPVEMDITEVNISDPHFQVAVELIAKEPLKKTWVIKVSSDGNSSVGQALATLEIKSTYLQHPIIKVPITNNVHGDVQLVPQSAFLGFVKKGQTKQVQIEISTRSAAAFQIKKAIIQSPNTELKIKVELSKQAAKHLITIELQGRQAHMLENSLVLETDVPGEESITIPIVAMIQD
jgi:hypothetical protein